MKIEIEEALEIFESGMDITPYDDDDEAAIFLAIDAIKKQMPMAVEHHHHCPICGEGFYTPPFAKEEHKELAFYPRYCYKCGQRIAWSQEEE